MAPGIQVYDASWLVACSIKPQVQVQMVLMQVGLYGSLRTHYGERKDGSSLLELVEYLCRFYPPTHKVSLVRSTGSDRHPSQIRVAQLAKLCDASVEDVSGASLHVPPCQELQPPQEILERLELT